MKINLRFLVIFFLLTTFSQAKGQDNNSKNLDHLSKEELLKRHKEILKALKKKNLAPKNSPAKDLGSPFDDPFFDDDMGFTDILRNMKKRFEGLLSNPNMKPFKNLNGFPNLGGSLNGGPQIATREDTKNIIIEIETKDIDKKSLNIIIKDGQIKISGKTIIEKRKQGSGTQSISRSESHFQKSFPIPQNVKQDEAKVTTRENKVIITFPKKDPKNII